MIPTGLALRLTRARGPGVHAGDLRQTPRGTPHSHRARRVVRHAADAPDGGTTPRRRPPVVYSPPAP